MDIFAGGVVLLTTEGHGDRGTDPSRKMPRVSPYLMADSGGQICIQRGPTLVVHCGSRDPQRVSALLLGLRRSVTSPFAHCCFLPVPPTKMDPKGTT